MKIKLYLRIFISLLLLLRWQSIRRMSLSLRETLGRVAISILFFLSFSSLAFTQEKIHVFPTSPIDAYTIYVSLAVFWFAIIFLIVIIKMKLTEIKRIQKLGIDKDDKDAPILD